MSSALRQPNINDFHLALSRWYHAYGRKDLPWRNTDDAYAIYISEIMLQQTQVKTVLERFYHPFLARFSTIKKLANATQSEVLESWQGLGYYSRARNLHAAAKQCVGTLPDTLEDLLALPGIGQNTAHAILAFAYRQPVAVLEANVKRVVARIFALASPSPALLWDKAESLLNRAEPFDFNQAMMDVGSMICTPKAPKCEICPANMICLGKNEPKLYPSKKTKKAVPVRLQQIVVYRNDKGEFHATARTTKFLGGLYQFDEEKPPTKALRLGNIRQQYSHFTLEADVWLAGKKGSGKDWYPLAKLEKLPMSMAERKILDLLPAK